MMLQQVPCGTGGCGPSPAPPFGHRQKLVSQFPRFLKVGTDLVKHPQPPENEEGGRGFLDLFGQHTGPVVRGLSFRGRVTLGNLQLHSQGHLQIEFALCAVKCVRRSLKQPQSPPGQRDRLLMGVHAGGVLGGEQKVPSSFGRLAACLEKTCHLGRDGRIGLAVITEQHPCMGGAPRRPPAGGQPPYKEC